MTNEPPIRIMTDAQSDALPRQMVHYQEILTKEAALRTMEALLEQCTQERKEAKAQYDQAAKELHSLIREGPTVPDPQPGLFDDEDDEREESVPDAPQEPQEARGDAPAADGDPEGPGEDQEPTEGIVAAQPPSARRVRVLTDCEGIDGKPSLLTDTVVPVIRDDEMGVIVPWYGDEILLYSDPDDEYEFLPDDSE